MCTALLDQLETGGFGRDYHLIQRKEEGNKRRREREREIERERREEEEEEGRGEGRESCGTLARGEIQRRITVFHLSACK